MKKCQISLHSSPNARHRTIRNPRHRLLPNQGGDLPEALLMNAGIPHAAHLAGIPPGCGDGWACVPWVGAAHPRLRAVMPIGIGSVVSGILIPREYQPLECDHKNHHRNPSPQIFIPRGYQPLADSRRTHLRTPSRHIFIPKGCQPLAGGRAAHHRTTTSQSIRSRRDRSGSA
jgi:hypothetical protein